MRRDFSSSFLDFDMSNPIIHCNILVEFEIKLFQVNIEDKSCILEIFDLIFFCFR